MIKIAASILAANFANLEQEICRVEQAGASMLHLDVMDGVFVPNISLGLPVITSIRKVSSITFDVHLMITNPTAYLKQFVDAGADILTIHLESFIKNDILNSGDLLFALDTIRKLGAKVGLSISPNTPVTSIFQFLNVVDMVLIMTVEPGFGGQPYIPSSGEKIAALRRYCTNNKITIDIEVDGGIDASTSKIAIQAGANVLVAGSAIFAKSDYQVAIKLLKNITYTRPIPLRRQFPR